MTEKRAPTTGSVNPHWTARLVIARRWPRRWHGEDVEIEENDEMLETEHHLLIYDGM
jgi:hypothetical protein